MNFGPLSKACFHGDFETVKKLLDESAEDNDDGKGFSLLHISCFKGYTKIVNLLLQKNSDVNFRTKSGYSSLHLACQMGHVDIVKLLLSKGADVNLVDNNGSSPLYLANKKKPYRHR